MTEHDHPATSSDGTVHLERLRQKAGRPAPDWMLRRLVVVPVIITLNVIVFLAWWLAESQGGGLRPQDIVSGAGSPLLVLLARYFLVSPFHLAHGWYASLLGAAFSHEGVLHLSINMFVLWSFGSVLEKLWGRRLFTWFYLAAAVFSNLVHCAVSEWIIGQPLEFALGASGAISGLLIAYALLFPSHKILLLGIIPLPAWGAALLFVGLDLWGLSAQAHGGGLPIGHGAHLGGALAGVILWATVLRRRFPQLSRWRRRDDRPRLEVTPEEAARLDELRRKLEREGLDGLNPKERAFLEELRRRAHGG